ncbi:hypothetical protein TMES_05490 [Thalassospira mesophila]|uniref:Uncharacterized protein n=1 Tax=Thalassospira mesophila TaxID=1293891 RepID=A0A1Y2L1X4_9PROT|nr:hypothetical protein TMES_05490 [Thalassospira mesophila]
MPFMSMLIWLPSQNSPAYVFRTVSERCVAVFHAHFGRLAGEVLPLAIQSVILPVQSRAIKGKAGMAQMVPHVQLKAALQGAQNGLPEGCLARWVQGEISTFLPLGTY